MLYLTESFTTETQHFTGIHLPRALFEVTKHAYLGREFPMVKNHRGIGCIRVTPFVSHIHTQTLDGFAHAAAKIGAEGLLVKLTTDAAPGVQNGRGWPFQHTA